MIGQKKIFGFSGEFVDLPYDRFDWKSFTGDSITCRVVKPNVSKSWYLSNTYHYTLNKYYYHDDDNCEICNMLFSDKKYDDLNGTLLKLNINDKKEKWSAVMQTKKIVEFFGFVEGYKKIVRIPFYEPQADQLLSLIFSKKITDDIADLHNGAPIKLVFKSISTFPYRTLENVLVGTKAQIFSDESKITKLMEVLKNDAFNTFHVLNNQEAYDVVSAWYNNGTKLLTKYRESPVSSSKLTADSDINDIMSNSKIFETNNNKNIKKQDTDLLDATSIDDEIYLNNDENGDIPF